MVANVFLVPETKIIHEGGGSQNRKSTKTVRMYMHAIFIVQQSKLRSFQREGRGFEAEMNGIRFGDEHTEWKSVSKGGRGKRISLP